MSEPISKADALAHKDWAPGCESWSYVANEALYILEERMLSGTAECLHYHAKAQQFFYILKGTAYFEVEEECIEVTAGQGLHIAAGKRHRILNKSADELGFLLCSQPSTANDRINCNEQ